MKTYKFLTLLLLVLFVFVLSSCGSEADPGEGTGGNPGEGTGGDTHTHTFSDDWTSDATNHWHAASCNHKDVVSDKAAHEFGEAKVTKSPTTDEEGEKESTCSVCGYVKTEAIPKLEWVEISYEEFKALYNAKEAEPWNACDFVFEDLDRVEYVGGLVKLNTGSWDIDYEKTEYSVVKKYVNVLIVKNESEIEKFCHPIHYQQVNFYQAEGGYTRLVFIDRDQSVPITYELYFDKYFSIIEYKEIKYEYYLAHAVATWYVQTNS